MSLDLAASPPPQEWGVSVNAAAIDALADEWAGTTFEQPTFDYPGTPLDRNEQSWFDYVTLSVSVLACLWPPDGEDVWHAEHDFGAHELIIHSIKIICGIEMQGRVKIESVLSGQARGPWAGTTVRARGFRGQRTLCR